MEVSFINPRLVFLLRML